MKMTAIENIKVYILVMCESSGNKQFFVRAKRIEDDSLFGSALEYSCHQTKNLPENECVERAVYDAYHMAEFFGQKFDDINLVGFIEENMKQVEKTKKFWRMK